MATPARFVAGVDGCKAGWIAVFLPVEGPGTPEVVVAPRFAELLDDPRLPAILAVDMPIGLPDHIGPNGRGPEKAVRLNLGKRKSSVFSVPSRGAVAANEYREACRVAASTSSASKMVSKQAFALFPKIREIDAEMQPEREARIFEVHPELAFWRLNGNAAMRLPKANPAGLDERRALLVRHGYADDFLLARHRGAGADDLLDAAACALIARRILAGDAVSFPREPERDSKGLRMAIWA